LKDKFTRIYNNRNKTAYCDQRRYNLSKPNDNKDEVVMSLVESSNDDEVMRSLVLESGDDIRVDDIVCNDWFVYNKKSSGNGDLIVG